jgi:hypothetical protein
MHLQRAITELTTKRKALAAELAKVTLAIQALRGRATSARRLSASARKRIADAQKARWRKWRARHKG